MNTNKIHRPVIAIIALALAMAACAPSGSGEAPTPTPRPVESVYGLAAVESVEIRVLESLPVQVLAVARGNLPDACTALDQAVTAREGNPFAVTLTTLRPAGAACADVLVPFERAVALDAAGLPAGVYTASVNAAGASFELAAGDASPTEAPATIAPQPTALPSATPAPAACTNRAAYVADVTVPDGTRFAPGAAFVKTWRFRNTGTCAWSGAYALTRVSGEGMGGAASVPLPRTVAPGANVDLSVSLVAPAGNGTYRSKWTLADASGAVFGIDNSSDGSFWVQIVVEAGSASTLGSTGGNVWEDYCRPLGGEGAPTSPSGGCVPNGSGSYRADGVWNNGEAGIPGLVVTLAPGACPGDGGRAVHATTGSGGAYTFSGVVAGTYCVSIDPQASPNAALLLPGDWTHPGVGTGRATVALAAGEARTGVDFGWDPQVK